MFLVPLRSCIATNMDLSQQPGHVRGKRPHGLHAFGVEFHLTLSCTVGNVPVLGGYYRHVHHLEHHVHGLECGRCAAATTDGYSRSRLVLYQVACRVEKPLHQREDAAVGLSVIDWSANYERIALFHLLSDDSAKVIPERTTCSVIALTGTAVNAHTDGLGAYLDYFRQHPVLHDLCKLAGINEMVRKTYFRGKERIDEIKPKWELVGTHTGRRTFICHALSMGIPPEIVMKWTGHSDYKAMKPYIDVVDAIKAESMKKYDGLFGKSQN